MAMNNAAQMYHNSAGSGSAAVPPGLIPTTVSGILHWLIEQMRPLANGTQAPWIVKAELKGLGSEYQQYRYGSIQDPDTNEFVDIRIPTSMARGLSESRRYAFSGRLTIQHYNGKIRPLFLIERVFLVVDEETQSAALRRSFETEIKRHKRNVQKLLFARTPASVLLIAGRNSLVIEDIRSCVRGCDDVLRISERCVNIEDPAGVASAVRELDRQYDLVVITRGGGDSIRNLDHPQLISAVSSCAAATAIAVGHEVDTLVLDHVADISFGTPSKFGEFLRRIAEEKRLRLQIAKSGTAHRKKQGGNVLSWIFRFGQNGTHVSERRQAC